MPEVILSYDYKGVSKSFQFKKLLEENPYLNPIQYLMNTPKSVSFNDVEQFITLKRVSCQTPNLKILQFEFEEPHLDEIVFNRIDGNHRLEALSMLENEDFKIPFCIVLLDGNQSLNVREKIEMELFHNINSKSKPLTSIEQYKGLFELFSVSEIEVYGNEFSVTKEYLQKYYIFPFDNISKFIKDREDVVLNVIKFLLKRNISVTADELMAILNKLEHTYFERYEKLRDCQSIFAVIPYIYYSVVDENNAEAKLEAYNTWFIKNKLYDVKEFDSASMIDVFEQIYDIRTKQVFVAMPFRSELDFVFNAICDTINKINRENNIELLPPIRMDKQIVGHSYDIVGEILENIKNAGLLIADLTYENANVYYEVGYAQGLINAKIGNTADVLYLISNPDKPDDVFSAAKFDVNHYKMISYKHDGNGAEKLKEDLEKELKTFYGI